MGTCRIVLPKKYYYPYFIEEFFKSWKLKNIGITKALWIFSNGFLPNEYFAYNLSDYNKNNYISALRNCKLFSLDGYFIQLLVNKLLLKHI